MDQWDPMREAYDNKNFNCYNQGVGRDLMGYVCAVLYFYCFQFFVVEKTDNTNIL